MNGKLTVWGIGGNGRNIVTVLRYVGISLIVDTDEKKTQMGEYEGVPIVLPRDFFCEYHDEYVIVSAMDNKDIVNELESHRIKRYFLYTELKYSLNVVLLIRNHTLEKVLSLKKEKTYCIPSLDIVSLLLYKYLKSKQYNITIEQGTNVDLENALVIDGIIEETDLVSNVEYAEELTPKMLNTCTFGNDAERIMKFRDIHRGDAVFVVATGPSLRVKDLERIRTQGYCSIGMNNIYRVFNYTNWRPDYYVASDGLRIERIEKSDFPCIGDMVCFFSDNYIDCPRIRGRNNSYFFHQEQDYSEIRFSDDISKCAYAGKTVAYAALQLAVYMGFKTIFLLGFDHSFKKGEKRHFYDENENDVLVKTYSFDIDFVEMAYLCARQYADNNGIQIINATRGGKLEVFERKDLDLLF